MKDQNDALNHFTPQYEFKVGDTVKIGNLENCKIVDISDDKRYYLVNYDRTERYITKNMEDWFDWLSIRPLDTLDYSLVHRSPIRFDFSNRALSDLLSKMYHFGVNMEPEYQRDFVWSAEDKEKLLDSIFNNVDIGKFCFIHIDDWTPGDPGYEILDGKQRLNTICEFYENKITYKGHYFNELCPRDQRWFQQYPIMVAEIREADRSQILQQFILLNRGGKPMADEQLQKVQDMLDEELNNEIER